MYTYFTLPRRAFTLRGEWPATHFAGAVHVHTSRAGGSGTPDDIAAAAARAGLKFVVFTDHGDATRAADPPQYRHGVLCLDAVEIGTEQGHLLAIGLDRPSRFPLAGMAADVVEDVRRLGGSAIAAHPDSPSAALAWRGSVDVDGIEWLNADSEWRDESRWALATALPRLLVRPAETIVSLFDRPAGTLARWDAILRTRNVFALAGGDAHARVGGDAPDGSPTGLAVSLPSYESVFRALAQVVVLPAPLSGDAVRDGAAVLDALTTGRSYSAITGIAQPAPLEFSADQDGRRIGMGESLTSGRHAIFTIRTPTLPAAGIALIADERIVGAGRGELIAQRPITARAFRVEVYFPGSRVPWLVSNPIYGGAPAKTDPPAVIAATAVPITAAWAVEHDATSAGQLTSDNGQLDFAFTLGSGAPAGQFAAAVAPILPDAGIAGVRLTARADAPMRLSVQLRAGTAAAGDVRWRASIYVDMTPREFVLPLAAFIPIRHQTPLTSMPGAAGALLVVVDTVNARTGSQGRVQWWDVALLR